MARLFRRGDDEATPPAPSAEKAADKLGDSQVEEVAVQPVHTLATRVAESDLRSDLASLPVGVHTETLIEHHPREPDWDKWELEASDGLPPENRGSHFRPAPVPEGPGAADDRHLTDAPGNVVAQLDAPSVSNRTGEPATSSSHLLGELLVQRRLITPDQLFEALRRQKGSELRIGEVLEGMGAVEERQLTRVLAEQFGIGVVDLGQQAPDPKVTGRLTEKVARELNALPLRDVDGVTEIIVGDLRPALESTLRAAVGGPVRLLAVPPSAARQAIDRVYQALADVDRMVKAFSSVETPRLDTASAKARDEAITADSPVAKVVTMLVTQALRDRASDIHLEPSDEVLRVRFRIDGALNDVLTLPMTMSAPLVSRIKILSGMNIVERRKAQDGQFATAVDDRDIDVRVSTMATVWGEKCVMRILDKSRSLFRLGDLGMPSDTHIEYSKMVRSPFGMVLCAGPTGSGKTTTLYATLTEIDERSRNVVTIEDPVEYVFPSINQIQTNDQAGITFADGLRAILRQDPDVILVGEIRDQETARIAVQAALTGHFVMSSLHATDSVAALHRFLDMGIEAFLLSSSVLGIVSQRLVRRVCRSCAAPYEPTPEEMAFYQESDGIPKDTFLRGTGCHICAQTGYQDRIGVYEFLHMTPEIRRLLVGWATQDELRRVAIKQGMRTLRAEGISLVQQDVTTISEVIRSIYAL
jgi:type IV pilus assembly protein PilB